MIFDRRMLLRLRGGADTNGYKNGMFCLFGGEAVSQVHVRDVRVPEPEFSSVSRCCLRLFFVRVHRMLVRWGVNLIVITVVSGYRQY